MNQWRQLLVDRHTISPLHKRLLSDPDCPSQHGWGGRDLLVTDCDQLDVALKAFLDIWKAQNSAKLSLHSDKGALSVILELKLGHYGEKPIASRGHQNSQRRRVGPSPLRRRERRAADKAVQQRAAEHAALSVFPSSSPAAAAAAPAEEAAAHSEEDAAPAEEAVAQGAALAPKVLMHFLPKY